MSTFRYVSASRKDDTVTIHVHAQIDGKEWNIHFKYQTDDEFTATLLKEQLCEFQRQHRMREFERGRSVGRNEILLEQRRERANERRREKRRKAKRKSR